MEYILRTNTVSKKYTNYYAVDKVSISIKKGEIYGLIGENGAGKSTLMKMIAGLVEPSEGSIELFGNFVPQTERYRMGCVIESPALYTELTAKQNLEVFRKAYGRQIVLATRGDRTFVQIAPEGVEEYVCEAISPINCEGDVIGAVVLLGQSKTPGMGEVERKLIQSASGFLGRQMGQ